MRQYLWSLLIVTAFGLPLVFIPLPGRTASAYAGSETIDDQVTRILIEESAKGKIRVVVLDFTASSQNEKKTISEKELKDLSTRFTEEFIASLLRKIKDAGKRDAIAIIDRSKLDDVLREKKLLPTGIIEQITAEIGDSAGLHVIVSGSLRVADSSLSATAKVIRIKDGEILTIAKEDKPEIITIAAAMTRPSVTILDATETIKFGAYKALPLHAASNGMLTVVVQVVHGNPIDVFVVSNAELENLKADKVFNYVSDFQTTKMLRYKHSAPFEQGDYYLVLRDSSLGIFSSRSTEVKALVQMAQ